MQPIVPRPLAWILVLSSILMLMWMNRDLVSLNVEVTEVLQFDFKTVLWENCMLDVLLQVVLIFSGVLGVLGLLAEANPSAVKEGGQ